MKNTSSKDSNKLTAKQKEILDFLKSEITRAGFPPSVREICEAVSLNSTSTVHLHLSSLEKKGYIVRNHSKNRSIDVVDGNFNLNRRESIQIPILKTVKKNEPLFEEDNIDDYFPVPGYFLKETKQCFIVRAKGESMVNAGIYDGDLLIVHRQSNASYGDHVLVCIDDTAVVRTYSTENLTNIFTPENSYMKPSVSSEAVIMGVVIGNLRFY